MPRGGHHGIWRPTPADIYRSRWKRFYKRSYRNRTPGNNPDRAGPHPQPRWNPDGVPSPWRLQYSVQAFDLLPPDSKKYMQSAYSSNLRRFMLPAVNCNPDNRTGRDFILRCLDPGRRGGAHSGYGRPEVGTMSVTPQYLENLITEEAEKKQSQKFLENLLTTPETQSQEQLSQVFYVRRLAELLEEKEIVWADGQTDPKALAGKSRGSKLIGGTPGEEVAKDRGNFPYVDEQASLIDDLNLPEILRLRHRTNKRRHPKWLEVTYQYKKWHKQYLRRRAMLQDEVKARMGILRQAVGQS